MERRDFILKSGLVAALGAVAPAVLASNSTVENSIDLPENLKPVLLQGQPPLHHNGSMAIRIWIRSSMTNGLYSSVECAVAPRTMGPPPHAHKELDEIMFVLEGTASILIGNEIVEVKEGGWHLRPRMIEHTFFNATDKPLRFVDMYFNQPFDEYLDRIFHELTEEKGYKEGSKEKIAEIMKLNDKFELFFQPDAFSKKDEIMKKYNLK